MSIRMVYESAALGLSLKIKKCSFFPRKTIMAILGTIVDLKSFTFWVSKKRNKKLRKAICRLDQAIKKNPRRIPTKLIASFIGLIWSISTCCQRAASVMTRFITAVLSKAMRRRLSADHIPLKVILAAFWSGTVAWSQLAQGQFDFWKLVNFLLLKAPISADVLGKSVELTFKYPTVVNTRDVSVMYQDASATASGGGILFKNGYYWDHSQQLFLYQFTTAESDFSSTLCEILSILKSLIASEKVSKLKIIFACDNWQSVQAIKYGSRIPEIQQIAQDIFIWCMRNGKLYWPVWLPRAHLNIKEADRRSRLSIPHD